MKPELIHKYLGRYGFPVDSLLAKYRLSADDDARIVKLAAALSKRESDKHPKYSDLSYNIGRRLGQAIVVGELPPELRAKLYPNTMRRMFELVCDCGESFFLTSDKLCGRRACPTCIGFDWNNKPAHLHGGPTSVYFPKKHGALTRLHTDPDDKRKVVCLCDCGNTKSVFQSGLSGGRIKSCGCGIHRSSANK